METEGGSDFVAMAAKLDELGQLCARLSRENGSSITTGNTTTGESATTVQYDGSSNPGGRLSRQ
jgi:hypothetical protein